MIATKLAWVLFYFVSVGLNPAVAVAQTPKEDHVPEVLLGGLKGSKELYIGNKLLPMRKYGNNRALIDQSSIDRRQAQIESERQAQYLVHELKKDSNGDGRVSAAEMKVSLEVRFNSSVGQSPEKALKQLDNMLKQSMTPDKNGDGYISIDEIWKNAVRTVRQDRWIRNNHLKKLLALDPNGDGILTLSELQKLSVVAFEKFDRNNNGWIDFEEGLEIKKARHAARKRGSSERQLRPQQLS